MIGCLLAICAAVQAVSGAAAPDSIALYLREGQRPAVEAMVELARAHPVVVLGDVHPAAAPKRLLSDLIRALHAEGLVDAVALEVPMTQQPAIRQFLQSYPEDTQVLIEHPLLLRAHWGASREYLDIYRTVWTLNRESSAARQIEILAIDAPRGPPAVSSRREALERFVNRDVVMELQVGRWREENPRGRILVFVGDLHALKGVETNVEVGRDFARLVPLAARLQRRWPGEVASALSDAAVDGHPEGTTRLFRLMAEIVADSAAPVALAPGSALDGLRDPIDLEVEGGEVSLELLPGSYTLALVCDLYIYLGLSPGLTPLEDGSRN